MKYFKNYTTILKFFFLLQISTFNCKLTWWPQKFKISTQKNSKAPVSTPLSQKNVSRAKTSQKEPESRRRRLKQKNETFEQQREIAFGIHHRSHAQFFFC